jgi:hypothetical protein
MQNRCTARGARRGGAIAIAPPWHLDLHGVDAGDGRRRGRRGPGKRSCNGTLLLVRERRSGPEASLGLSPIITGVLGRLRTPTRL